ncbi:hypothetical protein [Prosthecobacter sp.]|jgi:hypothetical protein|uniref:hypothetical protein n=1 Tax=Prosthecobacter sp. TaxID=1965333 RepID=UPI0037CABC5B
MKILATIERVPVTLNDDGSVSYTTNWFRVDGDGSPTNSYNDPCWQAETSLIGPDGKPVDAESVPYIVANPIIARAVPGIVLGCEGECIYHGRKVRAVLADIGPKRKLGEGSIELARMLGMNPSPISGGADGVPVTWRWFPGRAAEINGVKYKLKPL